MKNKTYFIEVYVRSAAMAGLIVVALATTFGAKSEITTMSNSLRITSEISDIFNKDVVYAYIDGMERLNELLKEVR